MTSSTNLEHGPQHRFPSGISQFDEEALAQSSSHSFFSGSRSVGAHTNTFQQLDNSWTNSPKSASTHTQQPSTSPSESSPSTGGSSPPDAGQALCTPPDGKRAINAARTHHVCPKCKTTFTSALQYNKHRRVPDCRKLLSCDSCGKVFKHQKSLQRHQGTDKSSSSCAKQQASGLPAKPFACTCNMAYARKDGLLRHFGSKHALQHPHRHRCRACDRSVCSC